MNRTIGVITLDVKTPFAGVPCRQWIEVGNEASGEHGRQLVQSSLTPEALTALEEKHAMNRLGTCDEVAELVLWLCSGHASFVTDAYYAVDGGYLAQ